MRSAAFDGHSVHVDRQTHKKEVFIDLLGTYADWQLSTFSQAERDR